MIYRDKVQSKSGKQVSFDLTPANPEGHANECRGDMDNMSRTTPEYYTEVTTLNANLPIHTILATHGLTTESVLGAREMIEANDDNFLMTSVQSFTSQVMDTTEASNTTMAPRRS